jgi:hypothetical protein
MLVLAIIDESTSVFGAQKTVTTGTMKNDNF